MLCMDSCGLDVILFPSMFAIKNKIIGTPCYEDPSCIGYTIVASLGLAYVTYRVLTRNMSKKRQKRRILQVLFSRRQKLKYA